MSESRDKRLSDLEPRLAEWAHTDPAFDEAQLRRSLLERMEPRRRRRTPFVLAAAAVVVLVVLIGLESARMHPARNGGTSEVVYEPAENVILVLREGKSPIYVVTEGEMPGEGGER